MTSSLRMTFILLSLIILLTGCGKGFEDDEDVLLLRQEEEAVDFYHAELSALNRRFGSYSGQFGLSIIDNQIWARVKVQGPGQNITHPQFIHTASRCPDMSDDTNRDGILDFREAAAVVGPVLIPLDSNITSQFKGLGEYPVMKRNQLYYYSEASSYSMFMKDLREKDPFPGDLYVKLKKNQSLNPENRVIIIYGISENTFLPPTVASFEGYPPQFALPIACGEVDYGPSPEFDYDP